MLGHLTRKEPFMANVEQERAKRMGEAVSSGLSVAPTGGGPGGGAVGMVRPEQRRALEMLVGGADVSEVAMEVGKSRTTIYTWLKEDAAFAAAFNQWASQLELEAKAQ